MQSRTLMLLFIGLVAVMVAGPMVVLVVHALVPLIAVIAASVIAVRIIWFFTNRY